MAVEIEAADSPLPRPLTDFRTQFAGLCIRCKEASTVVEIPWLCEPCRTNWEERAASYGGTKVEIMARISGYIKEARNG